MRLRAGRREVRPPVAPPPDPRALAEARDAGAIAAFVDALTARAAPAALGVPGPVTAELYSRLSPGAVEATEAALDGGAKELWDQTPVEHRQVLVLVFGAYYGITEVLECTGLVRALPPEDVHAMARGILAYAGDPMIADLVAQTFTDAGLGLKADGTLLDFGCSSGRVLRVLAAYRRDVESIGCDPNSGAVAWATEHLPMARFFSNATTPPLQLDDSSVDHAYAISIWSHFDAPSALAWLAEMHRVIRPGGALLLTTHGLDTLGGQLRQDVMTRDSAAEATVAMLSHGHKYFDVFGEDGDWGVKDPGWGNAYAGVDWVLSHATPSWAIRLFRPGALAQNQDVYVLERMP